MKEINKLDTESNKEFFSRSIKYSWTAVVTGLVISLFVIPFLAPLFFKFGNIFDEYFLGYDSAHDSGWYSMVAAITSIFFTLVVVKEFKSDSLGDDYPYNIDFNKAKMALIKLIKFAMFYIISIFLFSVASYLMFLITNLLSKWA